MPDLLLPTFATVLTLPLLALVAVALTGAWEARRHGDATPLRRARRSNEHLRSCLFAASLAAGTTVSLLVSGALAPGGTSLALVALPALLGAGFGWRLTRGPHDNALRDVAGAAAWWLAFGFLGGLTAQVLIRGGLLSAAALIALVAVAGSRALSHDGGLGIGTDGARLGETVDP